MQLYHISFHIDVLKNIHLKACFGLQKKINSMTSKSWKCQPSIIQQSEVSKSDKNLKFPRSAQTKILSLLNLAFMLYL